MDNCYNNLPISYKMTYIFNQGNSAEYRGAYITAGEANASSGNAYKFRLYPNYEQRILLNKSFGCVRFVYNYYLSIAKHYALKKNKPLEKKNVILSIAIPTVLHGIYDFCLMSGYTVLIVVFIVFVIFLYIESIKRLRKLAKYNKKIKFRNKFCQVCGKAITGEFCSRCGTRQT